MKKWILKAIVQKTISYLPYNHHINYIFQKYVTKGVNLSDEYFYDRLGHAKDHLAYYKKYAEKRIPSSSLEIGTGWYPIVPISFFLSGVQEIYSVDITFLTSKERLKTTLQKIVACHDSGKLSTYLDVIPERYKTLLNLINNYEQYTLAEILKQLKIVYLIEDARKLSLGTNSIDFINSNNTFEHVYPEILNPILKEFYRVVKQQGGIMSHSIDMSDHFAHFDRTINIYNFLRFTDSQWQWVDNSIQPQSRSRFYDYKKMYADLNIPITEETFRPGNLNELNLIPLATKYTSHPLKDVAISHCHFVSKINWL